MKALGIMTSPVKVVSPNDSISHARNVMLRNDISRVPVVDGSDLVGILTKTDMSRGLSQNEPKWRRRPIDNITVDRFITSNVITSPPNDSVKDVASKMLENNISGIPIIDDGNTEFANEGDVLGIVTKKDLIDYYVKQDIEKVAVEICTSNVATVHRHHTINHAVELLESKGIGRLIVVEENKYPVGILTISDLTFALLGNPQGSGLTGKDIKLARRESTSGQKKHRSVMKDVMVAEDVMSSPLISVGPNALTTKVASKMIKKDISGIPVIDDNNLIGIITKTDIVKSLYDHL